MSHTLSRRSLFASAAAVASGVLSRTLPALADCAPPESHARLLTPVTAPLPSGTAFVVALEITYGSPLATVTDLTQLRAQLRQGAKSIPLTVDPLAPGLARLVPATRPAPGVWSLESTALAATRVTFTATALPAPPPVPALRAVTLTRNQGGRYHYGGMGAPYYEVSVELASPPAPTWVAMIGNWSRRWRETPPPASFGLITAGSPTVNVLSAPPGCAQPPTGQRQPTDGMSAWFALVDAFGQRSQTTTIAPLPPARRP